MVPPATYNIKDPASLKYLAVINDEVRLSAESYPWEVSTALDENYNYIQTSGAEKKLRDNGSKYELTDSNDANSEWHGLSVSYVSPLAIVLLAGVPDFNVCLLYLRSSNIINKATHHHLKIPYAKASDEKWQLEPIDTESA